MLNILEGIQNQPCISNNQPLTPAPKMVAANGANGAQSADSANTGDLGSVISGNGHVSGMSS